MTGPKSLNDLLFHYGLPFSDVVLLLAVVCLGIYAGYRLLERRWRTANQRLAGDLEHARAELNQARQQAEQLQQQLAHADPTHLEQLSARLQASVAHDFVKIFSRITELADQSLQEIGQEETALREKQVLVKKLVCEMTLHAQNIVGLFRLKNEALRPVMANATGIVQSVLADLHSYAEVQGIMLRPDLISVQPVALNIHLVKQAIANIVHNAIKYSPRDSVVDVKLRLAADATEVYIDVHDRGPGISEQDRGHLFELRWRADGLAQQGSGIGLYYAREIVKLHGGDLVLLSSQPNQGSVFRISIPYQSVLDETT